MAGTEERGYATRATMGTAVAQTISAALLIQLALSAVFIAGLWLLAPRLPNQTAATLPALRVAALALFPLALATVDSALLRAHERMALFLVFSLATAAVMALGGLALLGGGGGLTAAAIVFVVAQVVGALVAAGLARHSLPGFSRRWLWPPLPVVGRALRLGAGLAALMALSLLYQRSGVLLLSLLDGDAAAGAYSAAARVIEALKALPAAFFGAMFPILAAGRHQPAAGRAYRRAFAALLVVSGLLAATAGLLARPILGLLFGPGFEAAVPALRIMVWSLPPTIVAFKLSLDLVVAGRERAAAAAVALTLLIGGGLTAWLIGRWSLSGAAVGLVVGEVVQVIVLKTSGVCGKPLRSGAGQ
jgi:O-antigen/teichoic acid export membrane protein